VSSESPRVAELKVAYMAYYSRFLQGLVDDEAIANTVCMCVCVVGGMKILTNIHLRIHE